MLAIASTKVSLPLEESPATPMTRGARVARRKDDCRIPRRTSWNASAPPLASAMVKRIDGNRPPARTARFSVAPPAKTAPSEVMRCTSTKAMANGQ